MELTLHVPWVSFRRARVGQRCGIELRVAAARLGQGWYDVAASSVLLSDTAERFDIGSTERMETQGAWDATIDVRLHDRVWLNADLLDDAGDPIPGQGWLYSWRANEFFREARVGNSRTDFTVALYSSYATQPTGRVIYARRAYGTYTRTQRVDVSGSAIYAMIHPVIPMPPSTLSHQVVPAWLTATGTQFSEHGTHTGDDGVNPSVIAAWGTGSPDPAWLASWTARICVNAIAYRGAVALQPLSGRPSFDQDITWSFEVVEAGSTPPEVEFLPPARGREVRCFGRGEGEVRVVASYRGQRLAEHRALVRRPVTFAARTIVLLPSEVNDHGVHAQARREMEGFSDAELQSLIQEANRYLRQVALALPDMTIEHRTVAVSRTVNISQDQLDHYAEPYGRTRTVTFLVIHSADPNDLLGRANGIVGSAAPGGDQRDIDGLVTAAFIERGSPSTSLEHPSGLPPGPPAEDQTMRFIRQADTDRPVICLVRAVYRPSPPLTVNGFSGSTMAHELGHVLGLLHRGRDVLHPDGLDGLPRHGGENLMVEGGGFGDLDIAQAKVMWASPLIARQRR